MPPLTGIGFTVRSPEGARFIVQSQARAAAAGGRGRQHQRRRRTSLLRRPARTASTARR